MIKYLSLVRPCMNVNRTLTNRTIDTFKVHKWHRYRYLKVVNSDSNLMKALKTLILILDLSSEVLWGTYRTSHEKYFFVCLRSCCAPFCTTVSLNGKVLLATHPAQPEGSQGIYCNGNPTYGCSFHTVMYGLLAFVHICIHYPLHSFLLLLFGFWLILFGVYLDVLHLLFLIRIWSFNFWPFFPQSFYFKEFVSKEQKLSLPEDHSNRLSGSVIKIIMICFVVVSPEKVLSSPSSANPVAHLSVQTDMHLWHILSGTHCTETDCCLLALFLQSSNNSAGPSRRLYLVHLTEWPQGFCMFLWKKKVIENAYLTGI